MRPHRRQVARRAGCGCVLAAAIFAGGAERSRAAPPTLPLSEVRPGMVGEGRTVFEGDRIEPFEVEILGTLPNVGPGQSLILGRLRGGRLEQTGVLAGMSGSPVFVEGRLVGAVAYSWSFAKEPLAGITPIEQMWPLVETPSRATSDRSAPFAPADLRLLGEPAAWAPFLERQFARAVRERSGTASPLPLPLYASGFVSRERLARLTGMTVLEAGTAGQGAGAASPLAPGAPVGLQLARGDLALTAVGTVTWVEGDRVLALGHPLLALGRIEMPLTGARVVALLPSLQQSLRLAVPLDELGSVTLDGASGVAGRLGQRARMIPVRVEFVNPEGSSRRYAFDLAEDPLLTPVLLYVSLEAAIEATVRTLGSVTLRLDPGSVIQLGQHDDVALDNVFAGPGAAEATSGLSAFVLYLLMNNDWKPAQVEGVNLIVRYAQQPRTARIRRVSLDRYSLSPGESFEVTVALTPYRGQELVLRRKVTLPQETPPGRLVLHVGGAWDVSRAEPQEEMLFPRDLDQLIELINRLRRNDRIYILAMREDTGFFLDGSRLPNLPPSVASVLSRPRTLGNMTFLPQRGLFEEELPTDYAIQGAARVQIAVTEP